MQIWNRLFVTIIFGKGQRSISKIILFFTLSEVQTDSQQVYDKKEDEGELFVENSLGYLNP